MKNRFGLILVVLALALSALACALPFDLPFELPNLPFLGGSGLPEGITLGETYRSEGGGFSISKVNGYSFKTTTTSVEMVAPNASTATGPAVYAYGESLTTAQTNQQALDQLKSTASKDTKFSDEKEITLGGVKGLQVSVAGVSGGVATKGKLAAAMFTPNQSFVLMVGAPEKQWDEGVNVLYDRLLESVALFKASATPTAPMAATVAQKTATKPAATLPPLASPTLVKSTPIPTQVGKPQVIRQWAQSAIASSEYDNPDWAASQATGAPDTIECGDYETAWASDGNETIAWIELTYATPVYPSEVVIYQSYNPSAVTEVTLISTTGESYTAFTSKPQVVDTCPYALTIPIKLTKPLLVNKVRVTIDQSLMFDWTEIDAVELAGTTTYVASTGATPTLVPTLIGQKTATKSSNVPDVGFYCTMIKDGKETWYSSIEVAYYSTAAEYVLGFNTTDQTQKVTLYLPKNLSQKMLPLIAYNPTAVNKAPSAVIFYTPSDYYAKEGALMILEQTSTTITGVVTVAAQKADDPTKQVTAVCSFSKIVLK